MIIAGLLLLAAAAVCGLDLIWKNHYTIRSPALFGQTLGIALILAGLRRKGTKARQHHAERKNARNTRRDRDQAQAENEKLHQRLDHNESGRDPSAGTHSSGATAAD